MRITIKQLKALGACTDGINWFKLQRNKEAKHILRQCIKDTEFSYANWYVTKLFTKPQAVLYSIFSAELQIKAYEKRYPDDARPRQAIASAKEWLMNPTEENRSAAGFAAESAARSAAGFAAESAKSAARSAAWSAAWFATESAMSAARSAAWHQIIEKAISILGL